MIRNKLFAGFAGIALLFGLFSTFMSVTIIKERVIREAQDRVRLNLSAAWSVPQSRLTEIETVLRLAAGKTVVLNTCETQDWEDTETRNRLEIIRLTLGLDFLSLVSPDSQVVLRTSAPYKTGDYKLASNPIQGALEGNIVTSFELLSRAELESENQDLPERAFTVLEDTQYAKPSSKTAETRGLVLLGAVPIKKGNQILGALYGGVLVNKNGEIVDQTKDMLFKSQQYEGKSIGSVTIFLNDTRIATTVRLKNGNRAIGTRVSKEVADTVLDNNQTWEERAFVVNDWYLTAYEPILNSKNRVIGMMYVGVLEKPYTQLIRDTLTRYVFILALELIITLALSFILAGRIARPLHTLSVAARDMRGGKRPEPVSVKGAARETGNLIEAFNEMVDSLNEREDSLRKANEELDEANKSLTVLNRSYMETVGFISHELKSPLATIMNYIYLIQNKKFGPLTEKQERGIKNIDQSTKLLVEMVRHYLNLSRIENGELSPVVSKVLLNEEVLNQLLDSLKVSAEDRGMSIENGIASDIVVHTDLNMTREVFENLLSNAIKYGKDGGVIKLGVVKEEDFFRFNVYNEGEGITPEQADLLFKKFSRLENESQARKMKGTGLGLFITEKIVKAHGGDIRVTSKQGEWIDFRFTLPCFKGEE